VVQSHGIHAFSGIEGRAGTDWRFANMSADDAPHDTEVIVRGSGFGFAQEISARAHRFVADEPVSNGGTDTGPTPYDLLLAALGSCASMTVALYARRRAWPLEQVTVRLRHFNIHATDCAECESKEVRLDRVEWTFRFSGALTGTQRARLLEIAQMCPVHRTLRSQIHIPTPVAVEDASRNG
jgi:putative redox protein